MSIKEQLMVDMKQAMKEKEAGKLKLSVIRMVRASIKNVEIDQKKELSEDEVIDVLAREVKMRRDSLEEFKKADRPELLAQTQQEIDVLMQYLPQQLSAEEVRKFAEEAVAQSGAKGAKEMGKVMGLLMPKVKGRADGKMVNTIVRELLNS